MRLRIFIFSFLIFIYPTISFNIFPIADLESEILPDGATFNSTTGNFSWTPKRGQAGMYRFKFKVTDGHGGYDEQTITIDVTP